MIKVSIFYPSKPGSHFDGDYYLRVHMPLAIRLLGPAMKSITVDFGLSGMTPDTPPIYSATCVFTCESVQAFADAFGPCGDELRADIPNYTNIEPVIQFSEITLSR